MFSVYKARSSISKLKFLLTIVQGFKLVFVKNKAHTQIKKLKNAKKKKSNLFHLHLYFHFSSYLSSAPALRYSSSPIAAVTAESSPCPTLPPPCPLLPICLKYFYHRQKYEKCNKHT